ANISQQVTTKIQEIEAEDCGFQRTSLLRIIATRASSQLYDRIMKIHDISGKRVTTVKVSSQVEERTWEDLKALAADSQQSISGVLTEAIAEYVQRRRVRPEVRSALAKSIDANRKLGELLAK
ncbi:MAG: hypothetical protein V2I41_12790, partial [Pseudomonadales bacterium]|nr:hypothetical protein [Pseudomonadales bacterium]